MPIAISYLCGRTPSCGCTSRSFLRTRRRRWRRATVRVGRIQRVRASSAADWPVVQLLCFFEEDSSRLLWLGAPDGAAGRLLCGLWDEQQCAHAVDVWLVSGGGHSTDLVDSALSSVDDEGFDIECLYSLGHDRILFNDMHRANLFIALICDY